MATQTMETTMGSLAKAICRKGNSVALVGKYRHSHMNAWGGCTPCTPTYPRTCSEEQVARAPYAGDSIALDLSQPRRARRPRRAR